MRAIYLRTLVFVGARPAWFVFFSIVVCDMLQTRFSRLFSLFSSHSRGSCVMCGRNSPRVEHARVMFTFHPFTSHLHILLYLHSHNRTAIKPTSWFITSCTQAFPQTLCFKKNARPRSQVRGIGRSSPTVRESPEDMKRVSLAQSGIRLGELRLYFTC